MSQVSSELVGRILVALEREADLEDTVTASDNWVAEQVGVSNAAVDHAIRALIDDGRVRLIGRAGRGGTRVLQLADTG